MGFKGRKPIFYLTSPFSMVYLSMFNLFNGEKAMPEPILTEINGVKEWRLNNLLHREDGPAVEYSFGTKLYFLNGQPHRLDGPACEYNDGRTDWYVDGKKIENPKKFIVNYLNEINSSTLSYLWDVYPCNEIEFKVFAKIFHELVKENLISVIKIKNKKTDFIDYIAVSNNFEVI